MAIITCKDKKGKPIKKDGLQKYLVRVSYPVATADGTTSYKLLNRTVYGKAEAKAAEAELQKEAAKLSHAPASAPKTISELSEEYLARCLSSKDVRQTTAQKKDCIQRCHILPFLGSTPLDKLTPAVLLAWKDEISSKDIGLRMRQHAYGELRAMLNYAVKAGYLMSSPLQRVDNFRDADAAPKSQDELHYYTPEQFAAFIGYFPHRICSAKSPAKWQSLMCFFYVLYYTGARKGEANALKWSDLDGHWLWIRRSVAQKVKGQHCVETPPKNASSYRRIALPAALLSILDDHRKLQQRDPGWSEDWRICGGPDIIQDTSINNAASAAAAAADLPHIRIHDFRHSHASALINAGVNIKAISKRLGHSTVEETWDTYSHLYPEQDDRIIAVLDSLL